MVELNIDKISIAHQKDRIIKIFDNAEECVKFADKFEKKYNIKLSCDPIHSYANTIERKGYFEGYKQ